MKNIFVVIPNWNGADFISRCLESLQAQTKEHQIIVVDNGSTDNSVQIVESQFPSVKLIKLSTNTGFSGGVNCGIQHAIKHGAEFICLFNNDAIADEEWLENLLNAAGEHPEAGIITGKFMRMDKRHIDSTGDQYSTFAMPFPRGRNQIDDGQFDAAGFIFGATGGASLYRVTMLKKIGLFDQKFFAYFEDVDISYRAQLAGWKVWYEPKAKAYHHVGGTSSKLGDFARYHTVKNFFMLYAKNMPAKLYWKYGPNFIYQATRLMVSSVLKGKALVFFKGAIKAFVNTPHLIRERRRIQKNKKVTTQYIVSILYHGRPPKIPSFKD